MKVIFKCLLPLVIVALLPAACGGEVTPSLAAADQPTLVFIYTDG